MLNTELKSNTESLFNFYLTMAMNWLYYQIISSLVTTTGTYFKGAMAKY